MPPEAVALPFRRTWRLRSVERPRSRDGDGDCKWCFLGRECEYMLRERQRTLRKRSGRERRRFALTFLWHGLRVAAAKVTFD